MIEKKIIKVMEKLTQDEQKEVLDFAMFINQRHKTQCKYESTKNDTDTLRNLRGIFKQYAKPELIENEKEMARDLYINEKYQS